MIFTIVVELNVPTRTLNHFGLDSKDTYNHIPIVEPGYIGLNRFLNVKAVIDISAFFNKEDVLASMCLPKCCVYRYTVMSKLENI